LLPHTRLLEVIPMKSKAYRGTAVNDVNWFQLSRGREGQPFTVGIDVGKYELRAVLRWPDGQFERPWKVANPGQVGALVGLLRPIAQERAVCVALEPSGVYGDPLRQALADARVSVHRVSPKAAHDYAEVFDGVPSQHDGKDAAVIAELAALGKSQPWPYRPPSAWEQELAYWVEWLDAQTHILTAWLGRIEALLSRHWPEASQVLRVSSATLLRALEAYGGPAGLAADRQAAARLQRWGGRFLGPEKVHCLLTSAGQTVGVRQGEWERRRLQDYAGQALQARREVRRARQRLRQLAEGQPVLQAQGKVIGVPTACVLWSCVGDPRNYACGAAYRKAMGLNLTERSSGIYQGKLKISKRGHPRARQWLYFAALRLVKQAGVAAWYQAKKGPAGQEAKRAVVGVMRKLVLALYQVAVTGVAFDARKLFPGCPSRQGTRRPSAAAR
jgi:transposase